VLFYRYNFAELEPLLPVHQALDAVVRLVGSRLSKDVDAPIKKVSTTQVMCLDLTVHC
jgi:hypothetical protein